MKHRYFLAVMIGCIVGLAIGEIAATIYGYVRFSSLSATDLYRLERNNTFIRDIEQAGNSYMATLFPHPYLGFVHRKGYGKIEINNVGLLGYDFPYEKDPSKFTILVTGGSVASQFAQLKRHGVRYLEDILNDRYDFGGKKVVVLNGGDGAWKQPQQAILFLLYADIVDAVITIDGFNEYHSLGRGASRLEHPASNFHTVNPLLRYGQETLAAVWVSNRIRKVFSENWLLGRSHLAWLFSRALTNFLQLRVSGYESRGETTIENIFSLPYEWGREKYFRYNVEQYRKYIRMMYAIATNMGIRAAFFLQPVPAIGKDLTEDEKRVVGDLSYRDTYLQMTREVLTLREENMPVYELLHIFSNTNETIYADHVHCVRYGTLNESKGYRLMSEAVATFLEKEWSLRKKNQDD